MERLTLLSEMISKLTMGELHLKEKGTVNLNCSDLFFSIGVFES